MSTPYEIPLTPQAQTFSLVLNNVTYQMTLWWNWVSFLWMLDIYDSDGSTPVVTAIPLVTGCDLLGPYPDMGFGGKLVAQTDGNSLAPPNDENLGITSHLYFVTTP